MENKNKIDLQIIFDLLAHLKSFAELYSGLSCFSIEFSYIKDVQYILIVIVYLINNRKKKIKVKLSNELQEINYDKMVREFHLKLHSELGAVPI